MLEHISACNALIEDALERSEGVLVHCQAGQSASLSAIMSRSRTHYLSVACLKGRSVTIVAAFLMYSLNLDRDASLQLIRSARPSIGYAGYLSA